MPIQDYIQIVHPTSTTFTYAVDPAVARVIEVHPDVFAAHWDSGWSDEPAVRLAFWNGHGLEFAKLSTGREQDGRRYAPVVINATEEDRERHRAWQAATVWVSGILRKAEEALKIRKGHTVRVVRGRKVPLGEYTVTNHQAGQYGPYVDLVSADGKRFLYCAIGNIEVIPNYGMKWVTDWFVTDPTETAFLLKLGQSGFIDRTDWLVIADYIEEHEWIPPSTRASNSLVPAYFAEYLRERIAAGVVVPTGDAKYHNQLRFK